jgi:hypothetical protein
MRQHIRAMLINKISKKAGTSVSLLGIRLVGGCGDRSMRSRAEDQRNESPEHHVTSRKNMPSMIKGVTVRVPKIVDSRGAKEWNIEMMSIIFRLHFIYFISMSLILQ